MGRMGLCMLPQRICSPDTGSLWHRPHRELLPSRDLNWVHFICQLKNSKAEKTSGATAGSRETASAEDERRQSLQMKKNFTRDEEGHTDSRHRERPSAKLRSLKNCSPYLGWLVEERLRVWLDYNCCVCPDKILNLNQYISRSCWQERNPTRSWFAVASFFVPRSGGWGRSQCLGSSTFLLPCHGPSLFCLLLRSLTASPLEQSGALTKNSDSSQWKQTLGQNKQLEERTRENGHAHWRRGKCLLLCGKYTS